jgi:NAD-dependent deacetylase
MSVREAEVIARALVEAKGKSVVFTGAGISTESGIPDFRGPQGLWTRDPKAQERATLEYFLSHPDEGWQRFVERFYLTLVNAKPNPAHYAIAELEALGLVEAVITQNVDCLHQKAGSKRVIELHGRFDQVQCLRCGFRDGIEKHVSSFKKNGSAPKCPKCKSVLKPAVVYFGERLPEDELSQALALANSCKVMLVVGSSLVVYPAAWIPEIAIRRGAKLFIVNITPTHMDSYAELVIRERAGVFLPMVAEYAKQMLKSK